MWRSWSWTTDGRTGRFPNPLRRPVALTGAMYFRALVLLVGLLPLSCQRGPKRLDAVPVELEPRVAAANATIDDLKKTLSGRLLATVQAKGPKAGIEVCSTEARGMTDEVGARHGAKVGRTSEKLRNAESNAPRPWLTGYLQEVSAKKASDARPAVFDLGDTLGVVQPLPTQALCLTCHGDPASIPADVKAALAERYPSDRATGYAVGDVRGVVWVEISKK